MIAWTRESSPKRNSSARTIFGPDAFIREDETEDLIFYSRDRFVQHLDSRALATVEHIIGTLVIEEAPAILDLMAGIDSHIPEAIRPASVVGLGLNERELAKNPALTGAVIHDLNAEPRLPFRDGVFDAVLNTVSVDYMTRPLEVFGEVARILKPGGIFLVIFSNRYFPPKVIKRWRESSEQERVMLVEDCFGLAGGFDPPRTFASMGLPRPAGDKYEGMGIPSDPVYAVYAEKSGGTARAARPVPEPDLPELPDENVLKARMERIGETLRCPYCGQRMRKWTVPQTPFTEWDAAFMYICFNDSCPYLLRGWAAMARQGNGGASYRLMYNPGRDRVMPVPVPSLQALKDGIAD